MHLLYAQGRRVADQGLGGPAAAQPGGARSLGRLTARVRGRRPEDVRRQLQQQRGAARGGWHHRAGRRQARQPAPRPGCLQKAMSNPWTWALIQTVNRHMSTMTDVDT
jgi:hypothetical protein